MSNKSKMQDATLAVGEDLAAIKNVFYQTLNTQAQSVVTKNLNVNNMVPVDEGGLGSFPWYWNSGGTFNAKTYNWLNNVFAFNPDGYLQGNNSAFSTAYYNVMLSTAYVLSSADATSLNNAINANAPAVNTLITDWTTMFGPIPSTSSATTATKLNYISTQVITWGDKGLTLGTLRSSLNPMSLLPNRPLGSETVINDLMTYLAATSSVANIQAAVLAYNNELAQVRTNIQPAPATATTGWMNTVDDNGNQLIVPAWDVNQSTSVIQNALYPTGGTGNTFTVDLNVSKLDTNTVQVSASGGLGGSGWIDWFEFSGGVSASYNMFSFDETITQAAISMTFNGVTKVTPITSPYAVTSGTGWWFPDPIKSAVNYNPNVSGYKFTPTPSYNFGNDGTFGLISNVVISQMPTFTLTYMNGNYSSFKQVFQEQSNWSVSFLGIPLASGSQSYYSAQVSQNSQTGAITITMTPPANTSPVATLDQLAYVIGAEMIWPGA